MPKRTDIKSILVIGSGPIVIGQACEFDYSGTQALKALKEEGYKVILVNSNPATIMTDPEFSDRTYIEPITAEFVTKVIEKERPDAVLPTMGGQTALNIAIELEERGVFKKYNCELIGANADSIKTAEDRELFRIAMDEIGLASAKSGVVRSLKDGEKVAKEIGYPLILRPSRTLGGTGGGIVKDESELSQKVLYALSQSPVDEVLIEESLIGWKEIELEVMRDRKDNVVVICGIENIDPMGVHTGDSITVAPIQTLTDKEYQLLRDAAQAVMRKIGVETGGSNVQFAINPKDGRVIVIEMNPRVSRSSALASKATGFPIAKIAAKLAVGYSLDEIQNDITKKTPASFEPSIDYVAVKIPRFNFEKFPLADSRLGTQMKAVGEVLSFGRTFQEAMQKALYSMEQDSCGFDFDVKYKDLSKSEMLEIIEKPSSKRMWQLGEAFRKGASLEEVHEATLIDYWFLEELKGIIDEELKLNDSSDLTKEYLLSLKQMGFSDERIAFLTKKSEDDIRKLRDSFSLKPSYKAVDTCAAEFIANTPYLYSTYDSESEAEPSDNKKIIILGSGPNRIGQGIEFDYCCVQASIALKEKGFETIMINCNPETVSTDYDTSDRLYFEPLTFESVIEIVKREKPYGVIVQFGGQTPLKLAKRLKEAGVPIIGTDVESIDLAEDREQFAKLVTDLDILQPDFATVSSLAEAIKAAEKIGFPIMIRPSFVLGGRAMKVIHNLEELESYVQEGVNVSNDRPVLLDKYLHKAIELDVDLVSDGEESIISGVMEHIERAGVHSGDSSCCLPPYSLNETIISEICEKAKKLSKSLKVKGLMNAQFAVTSKNEVFLLEVNPRASRTVPFVSKATGVSWARIASRLMAGETIKDIGIKENLNFDFYSVKACVFPFNKFEGVDTVLGPEMKSTGEVMGIHKKFSGGFLKSQIAALNVLPKSGKIFLSVTDDDKEELRTVAHTLKKLGYEMVATSGTAKFLESSGYEVTTVNKVREGSPHVVDFLQDGTINLVINTPEGSEPLLDSRSIRLVANELKVPTFTTIAAAQAVVRALDSLSTEELEVSALQDFY